MNTSNFQVPYTLQYRRRLWRTINLKPETLYPQLKICDGEGRGEYSAYCSRQEMINDCWEDPVKQHRYKAPYGEWRAARRKILPRNGIIIMFLTLPRAGEWRYRLGQTRPVADPTERKRGTPCVFCSRSLQSHDEASQQISPLVQVATTYPTPTSLRPYHDTEEIVATLACIALAPAPAPARPPTNNKTPDQNQPTTDRTTAIAASPL